MNRMEAIKELQALADGRVQAIKSVDRKHSWRPSEKAMTKAFYGRQLDALDYAIGALRAMGGGIAVAASEDMD